MGRRTKELKNNQYRAARRFRRVVLPSLRDNLGGTWTSSEGQKIYDIDRGVDWVQCFPDRVIYWSSRVWTSQARPHFTGRWYHHNAPNLELEVGSRVNQILLDLPRPHYHVEAWYLNGKCTVYVAEFDSIWMYAARNLPWLRTFDIPSNTYGHTRFIEIPHSKLNKVHSWTT